MLSERRVRVVNYTDWQEIEQAEIGAASGDAPRRKFVTVPDMLAVLN